MDKTKNARLLFIIRSIGWGLVCYVLLMILFNWNDIGKKQQVVVTSEQSRPISMPTPLPPHTPATNVKITAGNG